MKVHFWLCIMMIIIFSVLYFSFSDYEHCSYSIKHAELQNNNIRYQFVVNYGKKTRVHLKEFNRDQYNIDYTLTKIKDKQCIYEDDYNNNDDDDDDDDDENDNPFEVYDSDTLKVFHDILLYIDIAYFTIAFIIWCTFPFMPIHEHG